MQCQKPPVRLSALLHYSIPILSAPVILFVHVNTYIYLRTKWSSVDGDMGADVIGMGLYGPIHFSFYIVGTRYPKGVAILVFMSFSFFPFPFLFLLRHSSPIFLVCLPGCYILWRPHVRQLQLTL
ncbi:hypothetical protein F5B17DRAFT_401044 [Nemania serpens]|nr:hypothetical protein F5B17DRAFT_401044 [Nemania serpens]